jgi:hypothetical protein
MNCELSNSIANKEQSSRAGVDSAATSAGVPQQDDHAINDVVDAKVNSDIPGGNN